MCLLAGMHAALQIAQAEEQLHSKLSAVDMMQPACTDLPTPHPSPYPLAPPLVCSSHGDFLHDNFCVIGLDTILHLLNYTWHQVWSDIQWMLGHCADMIHSEVSAQPAGFAGAKLALTATASQ